MEKGILKIDIGEILRKYESKKYKFELTCAHSVIESNIDLRCVDLGYTKDSYGHADTDVQLEGEFSTLKEALRTLSQKENDYYYNGCGCGDTEEWEVEIWELDEDGEAMICVDTVPCPISNLEDFEKKWEKKIDDEFHEFTMVEWVNRAALDED